MRLDSDVHTVAPRCVVRSRPGIPAEPDGSNETFVVNLSNGVNATILDTQGVGTVVNADGGGAGGGAWTDDPLTVGSTTLKSV